MTTLFWQRIYPASVAVRSTTIGGFRKALGEEGVEKLLERTMKLAATPRLIAKKE